METRMEDLSTTEWYKSLVDTFDNAHITQIKPDGFPVVILLSLYQNGRQMNSDVQAKSIEELGKQLKKKYRDRKVYVTDAHKDFTVGCILVT